jgi:GT2 family glycosyltransferase
VHGCGLLQLLVLLYALLQTAHLINQNIAWVNLHSVSIVIANFNGEKLLSDCLISIQNQTFTDFEVLIVDNASSDDSVYLVQHKFPWAKVISSKVNLGYCGANNLGFENALGNFIVFLNNDTIAEKDWLMELVNAAKNKGVDICACKVLLMHNKGLIDACGLEVDEYGGSVGIGFLQKDDGRYDKSSSVFSAYGACMLVKREVFKDVGGFDADFFMMFEEVDLCWRARLRGYRIKYVPSSRLYHVKSVTIRKTYTSREFVLKYCFPNRLTSIIKNYEINNVFEKVPFVIALFTIQTVYSAAVDRRMNYILSFLQGFMRVFVNIHKTIKKRTAVQSRRKIPDDELIKLMTKKPVDFSRSFRNA